MDSKQEEIAKSFDEDPEPKEIKDPSRQLNDQNAMQGRQIAEKK